MSTQPNDEFSVLGHDLFGDPVKPKGRGPVADRFTFPPFTVLDAKQGDWQERKRSWMLMGIAGEIGRDAESYSCNGEKGAKYDYMPTFDSGTSIFDPVVCELAYRWFSPKGGQVIDPFAGGSVLGVVAKALGRKYWGCDLRKEQITANIQQAEDIFDGYDGESEDMFGGSDLEWVCGDSMDTIANAPDADFIFSCPPYGNLEVYSDDPADISNMEYHTFVAAYKRIILRTVSRLKQDRFACFVVGDFRDKKGFYRNFVSETINAFEQCGARLYNEAILSTSVGSACMRVTKQFNAGRKMAKTHQNILVFCKGDWKRAAESCLVDCHATE